MKNFLNKFAKELVLVIMIGIIMGNSLFSSGGIVLLDYVLTPHNPISLYNPFSFAIFDGL